MTGHGQILEKWLRIGTKTHKPPTPKFRLKSREAGETEALVKTGNPAKGAVRGAGQKHCAGR